MKICCCQPSKILYGLLVGTAVANADTVRGYVVNPITETPATATEVAFVVNQGGQTSEILRKATDINGRFEFSGSFITPGLHFALVAFYQGVPHPSSTLEVGGQKEIILEVYEPTDSDNGIRILTHNFFFNLETAVPDVAQFLELENQGEHAYVGRGQSRDRHVTELALPPGAFNLSESLSQVDTTRFFDGRPLVPGISQIAFSFQLNPQQLDGGYLHNVRYPTEVINIFLQPSSIQLGTPFEDLGEIVFHEIKYRHLQLHNLLPGQDILISLPLPTSLRWTLKWASLGASALVGMLALLLSQLPTIAVPTPATLDRAALQNRRLLLIKQLAQLDDTGAGCSLVRYQAQRDKLIDQALAVYIFLEKWDEN